MDRAIHYPLSKTHPTRDFGAPDQDQRRQFQRIIFRGGSIAREIAFRFTTPNKAAVLLTCSSRRIGSAPRTKNDLKIEHRTSTVTILSFRLAQADVFEARVVHGNSSRNAKTVNKVPL
jgi:hypothetical protein